MRKKKALINTAFSILLEILTVISGFILPRLFIGTFGSEVNGLVSSISSFIGYITLLQSGVGTVAKAALYKPLAKQDHYKLSIIVKTVEHFFRKIALITVAYVILLAILFPTVITPDSGSFIYTASLVLIIGISTAAQYFFGITHQMLLEADQRSYVYSIIQIITVIINTIVAVGLIKCGFSVQVVKLGSAVIFVIRPLALYIYSKRKYQLDVHVQLDNTVIKQRWDGFAQAIAYFVHTKTDIFVLTIFSRIVPELSLSLVSVYSVYYLITSGLTSFIRSIERSVTSALGNIIALSERDNLVKTFKSYNNFMHMICTIAFSTASITVFKFVGVYAKNVTDVDYIQYTFGYIIIASEYLYCMRLPYISAIYAAGKFKETKKSAYIEAVINIVISVIFVSKLALVGVAIGTFTAMIYRTISFIIFLSKDVINLSIRAQIKRYLISFLIYVVLIYFGTFVDIDIRDYFSWIIYAGFTCIVATIVTFCMNYLIMKEDTMDVVHTFIKRK